VLAFGSQFPDLVDKPLSWTFGALPVFTHTLAVAVPLSFGLLLLARLGRSDRNWNPLARAFVLGYLLHLLGDLLFPLATDGVLGYRRLLWPFVRYTGASGGGLLETTLRFLGSYASFLTTPAALWYVAADLTLLVGTLLLWVADDCPGLGLLRRLRLGR
jgi:membrane-bound metal-dependent hydrolase YbcI (DUF457 family)